MDENERAINYPGWTIVKRLGKGSFGAVYEIERRLMSDKERAALKVLSIPQDPAEIDELRASGLDDSSIRIHYKEQLESILQEYKIMNSLKGHTNIVYCEDVRYEPKENSFGWDIYIKMELLTPMLKAKPGPSPAADAVKLGLDIGKALTLCESRKVIHRDIKPQNIFLSSDGDYKLGDFGIAKISDNISPGTRIGTYRYMAPEVYLDQPYGCSADIYSLGLVMYWMLNDNRMPFMPPPPAVPSTTDADNSRVRRLRGDPLPDPIHGSPKLKRIVLKACAYRQQDRYQSAAELIRDLTALTAPQGSGVRPDDIPPEDDPDEKTQILPGRKTFNNQGGQNQGGGGKIETEKRRILEQKDSGAAQGGKGKTVLFVVLGAALVLAILGIVLILTSKKPADSGQAQPETTVQSQPETTAHAQANTDPEPASMSATQSPEPVSTPAATQSPATETQAPPSETKPGEALHGPTFGAGSPTGSTYELISSACTWTEAQAYALDKGGHLVCFETVYEYSYVLGQLRSLNSNITYIRIGGRRNADGREYYWTDEKDHLYGDVLNNSDAWCASLWKNGEPTFEWKGVQEAYMQLVFNYDTRTWVWNDASNDVSAAIDANTIGFLVEYQD